ncbi:hypothetical protein DdX_15292 [Ditylenchus destructor]|uniref:Uncharacterized protein n=1 Tax=Ditylenchus destructor TaxID=166010 RepID=A0AAD4QXV8_9BILA|nr:hypothetical protein DdX_15292 [Ditylenchus destructor]
MSTQFICSQCRTILDESERRLHISAQHLEYFPYECSFCQKTNLKFLATTEADMDEHISTYHNGNNAVTLHNKKKDKEVELNKMVEQCICLSIPQTPPIDSKIELRRALNLLDSAGTSTVCGNVTQNGFGLTEVKLESDNDDDVTIIDHDSEIAALSKNTSGGNLSEHPTQEHAECLAVIEHKEPNEDSTTNLVIENYDVPNTVLPKEPSVNISTAPIETNEPTDQAVARPITENTPSYENTYAILPKTEPSVNISIVPEPENFTESYPEFHVPRESTSDRKRELLDGISDNDSLESTKKRNFGKVVMNEEQLGSGGHCSLDVNRSNANGPSRYVNPSLMNAIFSRRNACVGAAEGRDGRTTQSGARQLGARCVGHAGIRAALRAARIPAWPTQCAPNCRVPKPLYYSVEHPTTSFQVTSSVPDDSSQKQIITKLFIVISQGIVYYETNDRRVHEYESLSDCVETLAGSELCSRERSILKCKKLGVTLVDNWSLSIVTNVVDRCDECELLLEEVSSGNYQLHEAFLQEIYERKLIQKIAVTLSIPELENVNDFIEKLKESFYIFDIDDKNRIEAMVLLHLGADSVEHPTTSFQVTSSVPDDSSQKQIITKLFIVISQGIVYYETNDRRVHEYESLSDCVETLAGSELCSRERSILKCKKLGVTLVDNWSLSIVTNVVDRCDECELLLEEVSSGNYQLHEAFLQEIYERKLIQKIAVTLSIPELENVNDFIEKLKERFRRAPQKCFKFELLAHSMEIRKFTLKFRDCILKAKESKNYLKTVIVEQRAIGS